MVREALKYSVVVIGGGIVGSAAAFFLARSGNDLSVAVIEADSTYTHATSPQGAGGVRQQFSRPENIALSTWSLSFYKHFNQEMAVRIAGCVPVALPGAGCGLVPHSQAEHRWK